MEYIYEKIEAWQDAIDFANQVIALLSGTSRDWKNRDLVERAEERSANIAVAISRAKCSRSREEIIEQLYCSRRSLYETMTLLELFRKNRWISDKQMPAHKVGRLWKFKKEEVDEWVKSGSAGEVGHE